MNTGRLEIYGNIIYLWEYYGKTVFILWYYLIYMALIGGYVCGDDSSLNSLNSSLLYLWSSLGEHVDPTCSLVLPRKGACAVGKA